MNIVDFTHELRIEEIENWKRRIRRQRKHKEVHFFFSDSLRNASIRVKLVSFSNTKDKQWSDKLLHFVKTLIPVYIFNAFLNSEREINKCFSAAILSLVLFFCVCLFTRAYEFLDSFCVCISFKTNFAMACVQLNEHLIKCIF